MCRMNWPLKAINEMISTNYNRVVNISLGFLSVLVNVIWNSKNYFMGDNNVMPHIDMHQNIVKNKKQVNYKGGRISPT